MPLGMDPNAGESRHGLLITTGTIESAPVFSIPPILKGTHPCAHEHRTDSCIGMLPQPEDDNKELTFGSTRVPSFEKVSKSKELRVAVQQKDLKSLAQLGDSNSLRKELAGYKALSPKSWLAYIHVVLVKRGTPENQRSTETTDYPQCLELLLGFNYNEEEVLSGKSKHILLLKQTASSQETADSEARSQVEELAATENQKALNAEVAKELLNRFPLLAFKPSQGDCRSVLHDIALFDAFWIFDAIVSLSDQNFQTQLVTALGVPVRERTAFRGKTPLAIAISDRHINVIRRFLTYSPELADEAGILRQAVETKNLEIVKALFENSPTRLNQRADDADGAIQDAVAGGLFEIVKFLVNRDPHRAEVAIETAICKGELEIVKYLGKENPNLLNARIFNKVGEYGGVDVWEYTQAQNPQQAATSDILHIAVEKGYLPLVQAVIQRHPKLAVRQDAKRKCPLYYNKRDPGESEEDRDRRERIRDLLVQEIMREDQPLTIRSLLSEENGSMPGDSKEICLDLTAFSEDGYDFAQLIETTDQQNPSHHTQPALLKHLDVTFESTLRYVDFPDLEKLRKKSDYRRPSADSRETTPLAPQRKEIQKVLKWLNEGKKVRKIIELRVPDTRKNPHTEDTIIKAIKTFEVEILDWKRLDLSIDCVLEAAEQVQRLNLYGSGNFSTISHWTGAEGVCILKDLKHVNIVVMKDIIGDECAKRYSKRASDRLDDLKDKFGYKWDYAISCGQWKPDPPSMTGSQGHLTSKKILPLVLMELYYFHGFYTAYLKRLEDSTRELSKNALIASTSIKKVFAPTKIALIDTGVDRSSFPQIVKGISYVYKAKKESPWWLAIDPHGTQMAHFICKFDPCCELYVAKAGENRPSYANVVKSIRWAIKHNVDIISMSFALEANPPNSKDSADLHNAISEANSAGIVLICSTADQGNNSSEVYPADYNETIGIAACNSYGKLASFSSDRKAKYYFQGVDVGTETIPYVKSPQVVSGSSVATAIGAGVASLTLACHRLVYPDLKDLHRKEVILNHLKRAKKKDPHGQDNKYVRPLEVFKVISDMTDTSGRKWLWDTFAKETWEKPADAFVTYWEKSKKDGWR